MISKKDQVALVSELTELEKSLASLYTIFNTKFPYTKLWPFMISEEVKHEKWLTQILPKIQDGSIYFFNVNVAVTTISAMIERIRNECSNAENNRIDQVQAVALALSYENLGLKKNVFQSFDSQNPDLMKVIDGLHEDIQKHIDMLEDAQGRLNRKLKI